MSQLQKHYPSEKRAFTDPHTGKQVWQLTSVGSNFHFYFTENSFVTGDEEIYFVSNRDTGKVFNVFHMDLRSGDITRMTDIQEPSNVTKPTKTPNGSHLLYTVGRELILHDTKTGEKKVIYTVPEGWTAGRVSFNCDMTMVAILQNERPPVAAENRGNYHGFKTNLFRVKMCRIDVIDLKTLKSYTARYESHQCGHLQFSPTNPHLLMFCHEGPWHLVHQRIWLLNAITGEIKPCYRQGYDDCVGHEFWTRSGRIFFDNRGPGHDGTITKGGSQMVITEKVETDVLPIVGLADENGNTIRTIDLPYYCNHYHSTTDETLLVGDDVEDLILIDISKEVPTHTVLTRHSTSWINQATHCHPTFGWNDKRILYASDCTGKPQLYMVEICL